MLGLKSFTCTRQYFSYNHSNLSNQILEDFHPDVHWLAEYAIGYLNRQIHEGKNKGRKNVANTLTNNTINASGGPSDTTVKQTAELLNNCERLIGKRFDKIRRLKSTQQASDDTTYIFDVIIDR